MIDAWPLENTMSRFWHTVTVTYLRWYKRIRRGTVANAGTYFRRQVRRLFDKFVVPRRTAPETATLSQGGATHQSRARWIQRLWPGKDFVAPVFDGRITVFRVRRQRFSRVRDESLGWRSRTARGVEIHEVPGDHATLLREPHVAVLAEKLAECLRRAGTVPPEVLRPIPSTNGERFPTADDGFAP
jgi:thioesterase domain-containing protein